MMRADCILYMLRIYLSKADNFEGVEMCSKCLLFYSVIDVLQMIQNIKRQTKVTYKHLLCPSINLLVVHYQKNTILPHTID